MKVTKTDNDVLPLLLVKVCDVNSLWICVALYFLVKVCHHLDFKRLIGENAYGRFDISVLNIK